MTSHLTFADITIYLANTGWRKEPTRWRSASIWALKDHVVFVPDTDDLADRDMVIDTILDVLVAVECRPSDEIAWAISLPSADIQSYVTFPVAAPAGESTLTNVVDVAGCVRELIDIAAGSVRDASTDDVDHLLRRIRLRPACDGGYGVMVGIPTDGALGRQVSDRLRESITAVWWEGAEEARVRSALRALAGPDQRQPFRITFRARDGSTTVLPFPMQPRETMHTTTHFHEERIQLTGTLPLTQPISTFSTDA